MEEDDRIGTLAWERWGPGPIIALAISIIFGALGVTEWLQTHSVIAIFGGSAAFLFGGIVLVVKIFEEMRVGWTREIDVVGMNGKVVAAIGVSAAGVVRVGSENWSAWSKTPLLHGESIVVLRREGNHLWVERSRARESFSA
jgi:membrane-bound ClpP family serine protease